MTKRMNKRQQGIFDETLYKYEEVDSQQIIEELKSKKSERINLWADVQKLDAEIAALSELLDNRGDMDFLDEEENFDRDLPTAESCY